MKIFVSHMNSHQRMNSAKGNFNNQVNGLTFTVDTSPSLSPATLVITHRLISKVARVVGMEAHAWAWKYGLAFNKTGSPKYSVGACGPSKAEVDARLNPSPEAGLRGWGEWAGRREGPYKAML